MVAGIHRSEPLADASVQTLRIPSKAGPHHRVCRGAVKTHRARDCSVRMRTSPMKLLGLNVAIPSAVRSGFAVPAFALHWACTANLWEPISESQSLRAMLRAFKATRHHISGRFRGGKLVGSDRHSKCFFAGVQCSTLMPRFQQRGRAARRLDRDWVATAQAPPRQTVQQQVPFGRYQVRRSMHR